MEETPREYKKKIDETRKKRKKNRDKLLGYIQEYELIDEKFKAKTKKEILENFEKNEKAEKSNELYIKVGEELLSIDLKYKELEELKKICENKEKEISEKIEKLRGYSVSGEDETTLKIQRAETKKIEKEIDILNDEIKGIKQEIEKREVEIKEIEEIYGKKEPEELIEEKTENTTLTNVKADDKGNDTWVPETLRGHRKIVLKELQKVNHTRHEIIKLLKEGVGVDEEVKRSIEDEISKKFFEYYDKKTGTIKMKATKLDGIRCIKSSKKYAEIEMKMEINGIPIYKVMKGGKWGLLIGNEELGNWFDDVEKIQEIGGKPCFIAAKDGKKCVMRGNKQQGDWFDVIYNIEEVGGRPCFKAIKNGKYYVMRGNEQQGDGFDDVDDLQEIGGKPFFRAEKNGKSCIMRGNEQKGDWFNYFVGGYQEVGGKPCFRVGKNGKRCIIWGKEQYSDWFDGIYGIKEIGGKPAFSAKKDGERCIIWGTEQQGDWFDEIGDQIEIGGKPCFEATKRRKENCVMRGNEKQGQGFGSVYIIREIGGKPCFKARKDRKRCIMLGTEQQGDWFDEIGDQIEIGGKPCFRAEKDGKYCVIRGTEQLGDFYDEIEEGPKEIGGKPYFRVKKDGKHYLMCGNEQKLKGNIDIDCVYEIGGKLCYIQKKGRKNNIKYQLIRGDGEQTEWFDSIGDVIDLGTQPMYFAEKGGEYFIMNGNVQITEGFSNYKKIDEDEFNIKYKITYDDGCERIITISKKTKKAEKRDNGHGTPQEEASEQLDTQRGLRESMIISRYEKLLNLKELIKYLKENKIYDEGKFEELKRELIENFFGNYEKAKENDGFQTAENEYRKIKTKTREHISKDKELKTEQLEDSEILENIDTKMLKIADEIIKTEGGSMLKRIGLNKLRKERDELEKHKNRIMSLQKEEFKLRMQLQEQKKVYGPKIDRSKLKGKSEEELRRWLNLGEITKVKTLKEYKEKHNEIIENSERIVGFIKSLDLGISEELKEGIIEKIEKFIRSSIEIQEGGDLLKMANDTEKYIEENIGNIIKELREKKEKIQENEEKITSLEREKEKAKYSELITINDEIFSLKEIQIKLKNEYDGAVKTINEKLHKYDGSDIESRL